MAQAPLTLRRWTRLEYERLVDLGAFDREPVELLGGQLIVAEPQGSYHVTAVGMLGSRLGTLLPRGWIVRMQAPLALDEESAPEPDLAVVPGTWADYRHAHPTSAALVVEVDGRAHRLGGHLPRPLGYHGPRGDEPHAPAP